MHFLEISVPLKFPEIFRGAAVMHSHAYYVPGLDSGGDLLLTSKSAVQLCKLAGWLAGWLMAGSSRNVPQPSSAGSSAALRRLYWDRACNIGLL